VFVNNPTNQSPASSGQGEMEMRSTRIHTNDKLVQDNNGNFIYYDSTGDKEEIGDIQVIYSWAAENEIEMTEELEAWIEEG
jgi:hypothetical protein